MMTTDTIREAAFAAFRAYFSGRLGHTWETCGNATQIRFELLVTDARPANNARSLWTKSAREYFILSLR